MWIILKRDKRIETTIDVNGARAITKNARVAEIVVDDWGVVDSITTTHYGLIVI